MTEDDESILAVLKLAAVKREHGERFGQAVFNAAYDINPERTNKLRTTSVDPFYNDKMVDAFFLAWASLE